MKYQIIDWTTNYSARWRPISASQADAWEKFLAANLHGGITESELNKVVASLCEAWRREDQSPTVRHILFEAIRLRSGVEQGSDKKIAGCRRTVDDAGTPRHEIESYSLAELRKALREARPEDRWAIVCWPADAKDCHLLEQMALEMDGGCPKQRIDWSKFRMPQMRTPEERTPAGVSIEKSVGSGSPDGPRDRVTTGVLDEDAQSEIEFDELLGEQKPSSHVDVTTEKSEDDW